MENQIYRIDLQGHNGGAADKKQLEFSIYTSQEGGFETKEVGIVIIDNSGFQLDGDLDTAQLDSLIDYLQGSKRYCDKHNSMCIPAPSTKLDEAPQA
jgi:hypothetical protein